MVERLASKSTRSNHEKLKYNLATILTIIFLMQLFFPAVNGEVENSTDDLDICSELNSGFCDAVSDLGFGACTPTPPPPSPREITPTQ